jgi:hypothetical protein
MAYELENQEAMKVFTTAATNCLLNCVQGHTPTGDIFDIVEGHKASFMMHGPEFYVLVMMFVYLHV